MHTNGKLVRAGEQEFTTGQVARMLNVAPRTVSKWFDEGKLGGHRLPGGTGHRLVPRGRLVEFARENHFSLTGLVDPSVLYVGADPKVIQRLEIVLAANEITLLLTPSSFEAGVLLAQQLPAVVVLDCLPFRTDMFNITRVIKRLAPQLERLVVLANEDEASPDDFERFEATVLKRPFDFGKLDHLVA